MYFAVIGDLIQSRTIEARGKVQQQLNQSLQERNSKNKGSILSPYTITLGDEFQALYKDSDSLIQDVLLIALDLFPVKVRFGIGFGAIETPINHVNSLGMDGPAFYGARDSIDFLKKNGQFFRVNPMNSKEMSDAINESMHLVFSKINSWPESRARIVAQTLREKPPNQIALDLQLTYQAVYKSISVSDIQGIRRLVRGLEALLRSYNR